MSSKEEFFKEIKKNINKDKDLFYNENGNKYAYKLFVRHLSFAENLGYGKIKGNKIKLKKEILLVDFEKLNFIKIGKDKEISIIQLKNIE
jgi:hypothetical protein